MIAFLDPDDALHDATLAALAENQHDELLIPLSVYAEILVAPYRKGAEAVAEIEAFLADFALRIETMIPAIARAAARLRREPPRPAAPGCPGARNGGRGGGGRRAYGR